MVILLDFFHLAPGLLIQLAVGNMNLSPQITEVPMRVLLATDGSKGGTAATEWLSGCLLGHDTTVLMLSVAAAVLIVRRTAGEREGQ